MQLSTVTQKGQITIPKSLRDELGIKPYDVVELEKGKGSIRLNKVETLLDIAGTIVPRKNKGTDPLRAREYMEANYKRA